MVSFAGLLALLLIVGPPRAYALRDRHQLAPHSGPGTVNFLFMLRDSLPHADVWLTFFGGTPPNSWRAWAHCTDFKACQADEVLRILGVKVVSTVPTKWCDDLVTAQAHLVSAALADVPERPGAAEKFVLLSDTSLPIKPFTSLHAGLLANSESSVCMRPVAEWPEATVNGTGFRLVKHSQWVVLTRQDATEFARRWPRRAELNQWDIPLMGNDGRANWSRSMNRSVFLPLDGTGSHAGRCPDEEAVFALIFGATASDAVESVANRSRCHTYVEWRGTFMWMHGITPRTFSSFEDEMLDAAKQYTPFYFARKFARTAAVPQLLKIIADPTRDAKMTAIRGLLEPWGRAS